MNAALAPTGSFSFRAQSFPLTIEADRQGATVKFEDGTTHRVESDWNPGKSLAVLDIDGETQILKVDKRVLGFRIRWRGADLRIRVLTPRQAELDSHIPEKLPPDTSKMLLCPMPGLVVSLAVTEGDEVQEGQALCTIEAMKMENILRAEKKGTVSKINVEPGASLRVDDVIMEFE